MTPDELKDEFRGDVKDPVSSAGTDEDCLWKDDEIFRYLDTAQKSFARLTECFLDSETYSALTVTANIAWVSYSSRILRLHHAYLNTAKRVLDLKKVEDMNRCAFTDDYGFFASGADTWRTRTGTPMYLVTNMTKGKWRLSPIPVSADTLWVTVTRLPLTDVVNEASTLEVTDIEEQRVLLLGMKGIAYDKQDADTYDKDLSQRFTQQFEAECARIKRAYGQHRNVAGLVRYGGL